MKPWKSRLNEAIRAAWKSRLDEAIGAALSGCPIPPLASPVPPGYPGPGLPFCIHSNCPVCRRHRKEIIRFAAVQKEAEEKKRLAFEERERAWITHFRAGYKKHAKDPGMRYMVSCNGGMVYTKVGVKQDDREVGNGAGKGKNSEE